VQVSDAGDSEEERQEVRKYGVMRNNLYGENTEPERSGDHERSESDCKER